MSCSTRAIPAEASREASRRAALLRERASLSHHAQHQIELVGVEEDLNRRRGSSPTPLRRAAPDRSRACLARSMQRVAILAPQRVSEGGEPEEHLAADALRPVRRRRVRDVRRRQRAWRDWTELSRPSRPRVAGGGHCAAPSGPRSPARGARPPRSSRFSRRAAAPARARSLPESGGPWSRPVRRADGSPRRGRA